MATCRDLIIEAAERFKGLSPGDGLVVDEVAAGLRVIQQATQRYFGGMPPLLDVDVTADYTPGENERVRVQEGYTVSITLPNSIETSGARSSDYGFAPTTPARGSTSTADGQARRAPRDGSRIEIVHLSSGSAPALYTFRADIDTWVDCANLTIDGSMPLNAAYLQDFAALMAIDLCGRWPTRDITPTAQMKVDEAMARGRLFLRPSVKRDPVRAEYF